MSATFDPDASDDDREAGAFHYTDAALTGWLDEGVPLDEAALDRTARLRAADGLFLDSLLRQTVRQDRVAQERRIVRTMAAVTSLALKVAPGEFPAKRRRRRWWATPLVIAATVVLAAAFLRGPLNLRQTALAAVTSAQKAAAVADDRLYAVTTSLALPQGAERELSGDLWVRGRSHFLLRQDGALGDLVLGSDGQEAWITPSLGPVLVSSNPGLLDQPLLQDRVTMPFLQITSILDRLADRYDLTLLPEEDLSSVDGAQTIRCSHVLGRKRPGEAAITPDTIELWTARQSGVAQRLILRWDAPSEEHGLRTVTFQLSPLEQPVPDDWYSHSAHHAPDRRIIRRDDSAP